MAWAWQDKYRDKLISAREAGRLVKSGDLVRLPLARPPVCILKALMERREELRDVTIIQCYPAYAAPIWIELGWEQSFHVVTDFVSSVIRPGMRDRLADFLPIDYPQYVKQLEDGRENTWSPDVFLGVVSPPDEHGYCSFGPARWYSKELAQNARLCIAEVEPNYIRTYGDNFIHVSEIDYLVEETEPVQTALTPPPAPEEQGIVEVIAQYAASLVRDGDTIQLGVGTISEAVALFLEDKNDLGVHSEIVPPGLIELVKKGVVTGKYKTMHKGRVVAAQVVEAGDLAFVNNNPTFELYSVLYVNSIPVIAAQHRQVAINSALAIDLTGQVAAHSLGPSMYSGLGGQFAFNVGALYSSGGRSIITMPATARGGTVSRIAPHLEAGSIVTTPRYYVDYVVTEYGIANLQGKTQRERAEALIELASPDFRPELREAAHRLFWP